MSQAGFVIARGSPRGWEYWSGWQDAPRTYCTRRGLVTWTSDPARAIRFADRHSANQARFGIRPLSGFIQIRSFGVPGDA